jgi:non-heme chloroperoxidase
MRFLKTTTMALLSGLLSIVPTLSRPLDSTKSTWKTVKNAGSDTPLRDGFFNTTDGARIHYLAAGEMTGEPPIVFLPGLTLTASLWERQLREFSSTRLTIAIDSRSQGESAVMLSGNTPERRAVDLHELIASLHISRFVIVGWSQGVEDAAAFIQAYGTDSLAGIVFVDSPVSYGPAEVDEHKEYSKIVLSRLVSFDMDPEKTAEERVRSIFRKPHPNLDIQHAIEEAKKTPPSIVISMRVMDLFGADRRPSLKKIDRPTLVIASSASPLLEVQKRMAESIAGARWVVVEGAGHAVFIDDPETFNVELRRLLAATKP